MYMCVCPPGDIHVIPWFLHAMYIHVLDTSLEVITVQSLQSDWIKSAMPTNQATVSSLKGLGTHCYTSY